MTRRFLFYMETKLGDNIVTFHPMYDDDKEKQETFLDEFKEIVNDRFSYGYMDDDNILHYNCKFSELYIFVIQNVEKGLVTFNYDSYKLIKEKQLQKKESI